MNIFFGVTVETIPIEFLILAITLMSVCIFQRYTMRLALFGLISLVVFKGWSEVWVVAKLQWVGFVNLFLILTGFPLLTGYFQRSRLSQWASAALPPGRLGGFSLLLIIFVWSSVIDNVAAALIGGTMALVMFNGRVCTGYLVAIVAAANAGGVGSVLGDTTSTMLWLSGVSAWDLMRAYVGAIPALLVISIPMVLRQHRFSPFLKKAAFTEGLDTVYLVLVLGTLTLTVVAGGLSSYFSYAGLADGPWVGGVLWLCLFGAHYIRPADWKPLAQSLKGAIFLLSLVFSSWLMPVSFLPVPSMSSTFFLGLLSSLIDNIPLTALCIKQTGYDWAWLAYAVGFGGSLMWFGSSAGVAIVGMFPHIGSFQRWGRETGWVLLAYVAGWGGMASLVGWGLKISALP